jgi:hypothetical protein
VEACHLPTILANALQQGNFNIFLLKIDIEGGEFEILDKMEELLQILLPDPHIRNIRIVVEYTLDADRDLNHWHERLNNLRVCFDVSARRKFSAIDALFFLLHVPRIRICGFLSGPEVCI